MSGRLIIGEWRVRAIVSWCLEMKSAAAPPERGTPPAKFFSLPLTPQQQKKITPKTQPRKNYPPAHPAPRRQSSTLPRGSARETRPSFQNRSTAISFPRRARSSQCPAVPCRSGQSVRALSQSNTIRRRPRHRQCEISSRHYARSAHPRAQRKRVYPPDFLFVSRLSSCCDMIH